QGTPASSPTVPATPSGTLALAQVLVPSKASSISSGNITDIRSFITINSNIDKPEVIIDNTTPTDTNVLWIDTRTNEAKVYNSSTGSWNIMNSKDADTLDGKHANEFAPYSHSHD